MVASKARHSKIDKSTALDLRTKHGLSYQTIADMQGVTKQAIHQALQPLLPTPDLIKQYNDNQSDIIRHGQYKAMKAYLCLDDEEQKEMIKRRGLVDFGILYDKSRLQDGLSTANLASLTSDIAAIRARKAVDKAVDK